MKTHAIVLELNVAKTFATYLEILQIIPSLYRTPPHTLSVGIFHQTEVFTELLPGGCHGRYPSPETTAITGYRTALSY